jgi:hypothetical protein
LTTRPPRIARLDAQELEGRSLLAVLPVATATPELAPFLVLFDGITPPGTSQVTQQVVSQQASMATLILSRPANFGTLQVQVTTDPSASMWGR